MGEREPSLNQLFTAIRAAARGESMLSPAVATRLVNGVRTTNPTALSSREIEVEVLTAITQGHSNKDAARALMSWTPSQRQRASVVVPTLADPVILPS